MSDTALSPLDKDARIAGLEAALAVRDTLIETLRFQLSQLRRMSFGRSSERLASEKLSLRIEQPELTLEELEGEAEVADARKPTEPASQTAPRRSGPCLRICRATSAGTSRQLRQEKARPLVDDLRVVIDDALRRLSPKSAIAKALAMAANAGMRSPVSSTKAAPRSTTTSPNAPCAASQPAVKTGCSPVQRRAASAPPPSIPSSGRSPAVGPHRAGTSSAMELATRRAIPNRSAGLSRGLQATLTSYQPSIVGGASRARNSRGTLFGSL